MKMNNNMNNTVSETVARQDSAALAAAVAGCTVRDMVRFQSAREKAPCAVQNALYVHGLIMRDWRKSGRVNLPRELFAVAYA